MKKLEIKISLKIQTVCPTKEVTLNPNKSIELTPS